MRLRLPASTSPGPTGRRGGLGVRAHLLGHRREQPGEQRVRRRVETQAGRTGRQRVEVLGPADGAAVDRLDVDQAGVTQPLQVQPDGVGVQAECVGEVLGGERRGRGGQFAVHREARLIAQGLEDLELHVLTVQ